MRPFIKKDNQEYPDYYGIKITYVTGRVVEYSIALHRIVDTHFRLLELVTHDDKWKMIPLANVELFEFDKAFSKIMAIKEKDAAAKKGLK